MVRADVRVPKKVKKMLWEPYIFCSHWDTIHAHIHSDECTLISPSVIADAMGFVSPVLLFTYTPSSGRMIPIMIACCSEISVPSAGLTTDLMANVFRSSPSAAISCSVSAVWCSSAIPVVRPSTSTTLAFNTGVISIFSPSSLTLSTVSWSETPPIVSLFKPSSGRELFQNLQYDKR